MTKIYFLNHRPVLINLQCTEVLMMLFISMSTMTIDEMNVGRVRGPFFGQRRRKPNTEKKKAYPERTKKTLLYRYQEKRKKKHEKQHIHINSHKE